MYLLLKKQEKIARFLLIVKNEGAIGASPGMTGSENAGNRG